MSEKPDPISAPAARVDATTRDAFRRVFSGVMAAMFLAAAGRLRLAERADAIYRCAFLRMAAITATGALIALTVPKLGWTE